MPTNKPARPQQVTLTRKDIEEIATQAAYREVQRIFGELDTQETVPLEGARTTLDIPPGQPITRTGDSLHLYIDHNAPPLVPTPENTVATNLVTVHTGERRFVAHLPHKDGGLPEQVRGTRNMDTGQVVLDDAQGVYRSWVEFLNACHASGQTPTKIEDE